MIKRLFAPTLMLLLCLTLGSCGSFAGFVSDHWPTWAGGEPNDLPPRPGAPGYDEFISHQQAKDAAAAAPATSPAAPPAPAVGATPAADNGNTQPTTAGYRRTNDQGALQGGLY